MEAYVTQNHMLYRFISVKSSLQAYTFLTITYNVKFMKHAIIRPSY